MLEAYVALFKGTENILSEANCGVHHILFDLDNGEALLARNTCDGVFAGLGSVGNDESASVLGVVGVLNVYGNACLSYREDSVLVENGSAHVCKLSQLSVGDSCDRLGVVNDPGVADKEAAYVSPVLIKNSVDSICNDRTCNIGAASGEGLDGVVGH